MRIDAKLVVALLLFAALGPLYAQEQGDDAQADAATELSAPVQIGSLSAPLSGSGLLASGLGNFDATTLPPSALNAATPRAAALAPLQSALDHSSPARTAPIATNEPAAESSAPRETQEPYFAKVLTQLGVAPSLATDLGKTTREQTPESSAAPKQTPDLTAAAVTGPAGASLSQKQKIAVILSAVLGAHPSLQVQHADFMTEIERQAGVSPKDVTALIQAAGFNGAPETDGLSAAKGGWTALWGRRTAFAAKTAAAARAILNARTPEERVQAENSLISLRQNPEFAIFPPSVRRASESLLAAAQAQGRTNFASPLNEAARAQAPPFTTQTRALEDARSQAQDLGLPGATGTQTVAARASPLDALKDGNFAVLPQAEVPDFPLESRILAAIELARSQNPIGEFWQWSFLEEGSREWRTNKKQTPELVADVRGFVENLTRELQASLPNEDIKIRDVQIRVNPPPQTGAKLHVDGGYITATCALKGPGTVIYDDSGSRARRVQAQPGAVAFVSNLDREFVRDIPGAVHSAPSEETAGRIVLIVRYKSAGQAPIPPQARLRQQERIAQRIKALEKSGL